MKDEQKAYMMRLAAMFKQFSERGEVVEVAPDLSGDIANHLLAIVMDNTPRIITATN